MPVIDKQNFTSFLSVDKTLFGRLQDELNQAQSQLKLKEEQLQSQEAKVNCIWTDVLTPVAHASRDPKEPWNAYFSDDTSFLTVWNTINETVKKIDPFESIFLILSPVVDSRGTTPFLNS